jgi:hypothetical protein
MRFIRGSKKDEEPTAASPAAPRGRGRAPEPAPATARKGAARPAPRPASRPAGGDLPARDAAEVLLGRARERIGTLREVAGERLRLREAAERGNAARLGAKEIRRLAGRNAQVRRRLEQAVARAEERAERAAELRQFQEEAIDSAQRDLDGMLDTFRGLSIPGVQEIFAAATAAPAQPAAQAAKRGPRKAAPRRPRAGGEPG